jgi:hypothetical protein
MGYVQLGQTLIDSRTPTPTLKEMGLSSALFAASDETNCIIAPAKFCPIISYKLIPQNPQKTV